MWAPCFPRIYLSSCTHTHTHTHTHRNKHIKQIKNTHNSSARTHTHTQIWYIYIRRILYALHIRMCVLLFSMHLILHSFWQSWTLIQGTTFSCLKEIKFNWKMKGGRKRQVNRYLDFWDYDLTNKWRETHRAQCRCPRQWWCWSSVEVGGGGGVGGRPGVSVAFLLFSPQFLSF